MRRARRDGRVRQPARGDRAPARAPTRGTSRSTRATIPTRAERPTGRIEGTIRLFGASSRSGQRRIDPDGIRILEAVHGIAPTSDPEPPTTALYPQGSFVSGELVLQTERAPQDVIDHLHLHANLHGYRFSLGVYAGTNLVSVRIRDRADLTREITEAETIQILRDVSTHPDVRTADPNFIRTRASDAR